MAVEKPASGSGLISSSSSLSPLSFLSSLKQNSKNFLFQAESDIHPCARQPHVGRAQRRARRYVEAGGGEAGGGGGGGDEDWFKLLSNCPVIHQQCLLCYYTNNVSVQNY